MALFTRAFVRLVLASAVLLTLRFALDGAYPFALGLALSLVGYAYLVRWGDRPIEDRLLSPSR